MIQALLDEFGAAALPGPFEYPWCHHDPGTGGHNQHRLIGCLIHGNEHGTLPAAIRLVRAMRGKALRPAGPVTVLLGNTQAALADVRFLEEDFNRVFTFDRPARSLERQLALEVQPILDQADWFLDLHQTQTPTRSPFWTFPWQPELGLLARALRIAPLGLTRRPGEVFSGGTCCLDEYVRGRGKFGITAELGFKGQDAEQAEQAFRGMTRFLEVTDQVGLGGPEALAAAAEASPPLSWYQAVQVYRPETTAHRLRPHLENWMQVSEGERLSEDGAPLIQAEAAGRLLFPKYPPRGVVAPELFRLATEVSDPSMAFG